MDYSDIKGRTDRLRQELAEVAEQNRKYLSRKNHSREEQGQHRLLQDRVCLIRADLQSLVERTKTVQSYGRASLALTRSHPRIA